jgi:hypothetical protein
MAGLTAAEVKRYNQLKKEFTKIGVQSVLSSFSLDSTIRRKDLLDAFESLLPMNLPIGPNPAVLSMDWLIKQKENPTIVEKIGQERGDSIFVLIDQENYNE